MKYTRTSLKKLEDLCKELGYKVRYEQGHFQSGYCRVESQKVIVINKFFDVEGRINCFLDLIPDLPVETESLPADSLRFYKSLPGKSDKVEL